MKDPEMRARIEKAGAEPVDLGIKQAEAFLKSEYDRWTAFVRQAGITLETDK